MNIFEMLYPRFYFDKSKTIRLFEAFAGIGCQAMALKRITDNIELVGISEIDKPAIQSYMAIHGQVKNYGDITKMETIPECDIFTWSFPCTDLSKAGKQKGLTNTRSGLVYEVLRLLKSTDKKPKVLIMENVIDLVQVKFVKPFNEIQAELEQLGYTNYNEVLNAKDYGIPQNRERCFMVSILGEYAYSFPRKIDATKKLADLLEKQVDNKYYLSSKMFNYFTQNNQRQKDRGNGFRFEPVNDLEKEIANTITTKAGQRLTDNYIDETEFAWKRQFRPLDETAETSFTITTREGQCAEATYIKDSKNNKVMRVGGLYDKPGKRHQIGSIFNKDGLSPTLDTAAGGNRQPYIVEELPTKVLCAKEPNLKSIMASNLIQEGKVHENDVIRHSYTNSRMKDGKIAAGNNMSPTLDTRADCFGVVVKEEKEPSRLAIRKLTPKECLRLMAFSNDDYQALHELGISNSKLYFLAGNSIVVTVIVAIFSTLFSKDHEEIINHYINQEIKENKE